MNIYTIHIIMLLSFSLELSHRYIQQKWQEKKKVFCFHNVQAASKILLEVPQVGFYIKKLVNRRKRKKCIRLMLNSSAFEYLRFLKFWLAFSFFFSDRFRQTVKISTFSSQISYWKFVLLTRKLKIL